MRTWKRRATVREIDFESAVTLTGIILQSTLGNTANESITFNAGALGDVTVTGAVGDLGNGDIVITDAFNVTFSSTVDADNFTQIDGQGTTLFSDTIDLAADFTFTGNNLTINGAANTIDGDFDANLNTAAGVLTFGNSATTTVGGVLTQDIIGAVANTGVVIGANLETTGNSSEIDFESAVTLTGNADEIITLTTNGAADSDIILQSTLGNTANESITFVQCRSPG